MIKKRIKKYSKVLKKSKQKIQKRLERKQSEEQAAPIMTASNIHYEMNEETLGTLLSNLTYSDTIIFNAHDSINGGCACHDRPDLMSLVHCIT